MKGVRREAANEEGGGRLKGIMQITFKIRASSFITIETVSLRLLLCILCLGVLIIANDLFSL